MREGGCCQWKQIGTTPRRLLMSSSEISPHHPPVGAVPSVNSAEKRSASDISSGSCSWYCSVAPCASHSTTSLTRVNGKLLPANAPWSNSRLALRSEPVTVGSWKKRSLRGGGSLAKKLTPTPCRP